MSDRVYPVSCGTQYGDWTDSNCRQCIKGADIDNPPAVCPCDLEQALLVACFDDGTVGVEIGTRMGAVQNKGCYGWECPERQPLGEGKTNG